MQVLQNSLDNMDQKKLNLNPVRLNQLQFSTRYAKSKENSKKLGGLWRPWRKLLQDKRQTKISVNSVLMQWNQFGDKTVLNQ